MMTFSVIYLLGGFPRQIWGFIYDWYVGGFLAVGHATVNFLERLDQILAWRITLRNFLQPLYQDYSPIGYGFGLVFRTTRLLIGTIVYIFIIVAFSVIYLLWAAAPLYIILRMFL